MQNTLIAIGVVAVLGFLVLIFVAGQDKDADSAVDSESDPTSMTDRPAGPALDIVATAAADEDFSTLVAAVTAADLVETLQGDGPFTVFAPVNQAFDELPAGTLDTLLVPDNQADLTNILTYHVVPGVVRAADLTDGMTLTTVNGAALTIDLSPAGVKINDANVMMVDIEATDGIIHVIDAVLLPPTQ